MPPKKQKQNKPPAKEEEKEDEIDTPKGLNVLQARKTLEQAMALMSLAKDKEVMEAEQKKHDFWDTQPVLTLTHAWKDGEKPGPIDEPKTVEQIRKEPYNLPDGFEWRDVDIDNDKEVEEIYTLLTENYVEDDDNMFRFNYSIEFLRWALKPPGWLKQWHVGVRVSKTGKFVGFITAIPSTMIVYGDNIKMVEINFLCVHKKLRDKRLAPVLIKEITRRVNLTNIWQASYTAGRVLPKPVARCRYYHRSLNPKKLIAIGFSGLPPRMTLARTIKLFAVPEEPQCKGIRPIERRDVPSATKLLNKYLEKFEMKQHFDEREFEHWFMPRKGVVSCFVIEDPKTKEITDMCSYYNLPSTVIGNDKYKILNAAYSYYNVATTHPLEKIMSDALTLAKKEEYDVFNCLNIQENATWIDTLKFKEGDGNLQYYIYNWKCPEMPPMKMGLVLL